MRRLAIASFAFSAAIFACNYIIPGAWPPVCAVVFAVCGAALACMRRKWLRGFVLALIAAAVGFGCFYVHEQRTRVPARALDGETLSVTARLLEYPQAYDGYCRARVRLEGEGLPRVEAMLYDNGFWLSAAEPGQRLVFTGKLSAADTRYGEKYDYYNARDIYLTINARSAVLCLDRGFDLRTIPARIHRALSRRVEQLFPEDVLPFVHALMLGDKTALYRDLGLELAMSRAGLMHVVAVSGMHIAFLVGLLQLLLGRSRRCSLLCIALIWLFVLVTGAGPSSVRAGVMQSLLLFAPVVRRENDPPTSLSAALALLLLVNPYAAASVSLQLSFASVAGIMLFTERLHEIFTLPFNLGIFRRPVEFLMDGLAVSLGAMVFSVPLMALHFGMVALLSPLSNFFALWAVSLCFSASYLACFLSMLLPALGAAAAWLAAWAARYVILVARLVSAVPFAALYMKNAYAGLWLLFCYAAFAVAALCPIRKWMRLLLPAGLSALALLLVMGLTRASYSATPGVITVLDVGQGQCICVFSGDRTVVIDCGGLWTLDDAGETAGAYLRACGREKVDLLLLTHLHEDHANGVPMLLEMVVVDKIVLPEEPDADDALMAAISEGAKRRDTELLLLRGDLRTELGGIACALYAPQGEGSVNERCIMSRISLGGYDMLVTGDSSMAQERALLAREPLDGIELLIAGHHGARSASSGELLGGIGADTAVISVGYNNYGHPAQETLERFAAYGYNVYRTDRDGDLTIRVGKEYGEAHG